MCGISGLLLVSGEMDKDVLQNTVRRMADSLTHRGPDSQGCWIEEDGSVGLGHRRLSIIDLSPTGHQPMHSHSGRYVLVFNGELYNFEALRQELKKKQVAFRGRSDTEVALAAIEVWGIKNALERFVGMFAFGLWDKSERILYLARDRIGEKPLYYGRIGRSVAFASELKAFHQIKSWAAEVDRSALSLYLRHNYVPAPYSIYKGVKKLTPGTILALELRDTQIIERGEEYWSAKDVVRQAVYDRADCDRGSCVDALDALLRNIVRQKMLSDVPLGAFLSGGVDSSTVVAIMQEVSSEPVKTFTIGFREREFNEAVYARKIAEHLGTDHTELYVSGADARAVIPDLSRIYDEPFSDSSQIPTVLISKLARSRVTVSLSGDGGDELFGGYDRYTFTRGLWRKLSRIPVGTRKVGAKALLSVSPGRWDKWFDWVGPLLSLVVRQRVTGDRAHKLARLLCTESERELYRRLVSHWDQPAEIVINGLEPRTRLGDDALWTAVSDSIEKMMLIDLLTYLPDDILVKVDRASMSTGLEVRVPFLDQRLIEYAWKLPLSMKVNGDTGKWILRQVLARYVPNQLFERPKMGFGVPLAEWLRGPLREWAEALLAEERLIQDGFFCAEAIRSKWEEHVSGRQNWQYHIWDILMFQSWLDGERERAAG